MKASSLINNVYQIQSVPESIEEPVQFDDNMISGTEEEEEDAGMSSCNDEETMKIVKDTFDKFMRKNPRTNRLNQYLRCRICLKEFPKLFSAKDHARTHQGIRPFSCIYCN